MANEEIITIDISGDIQTLRQLESVTRWLEHDFDRAIGTWVQMKVRFFQRKAYPPKRPRQVYVRTGRLKRSWNFGRVRQNHWFLGNVARDPETGHDYASNVVGNEEGAGQGQFFVGRWWKFADEVKLAPTLEGTVRDSLENAIRRGT